MIQETSLEAYRSTLPRRETTREQIMTILRATGGTTIEQMARVAGRLQNSISGTLRGLAVKGVVQDSGRKGVTQFGNPAIIWEVVSL